MAHTYRFVVLTENGLKNFLKVHERSNGDLIVSPRGKYHSTPVGSANARSTQVNEEDVATTNITIHPNLGSKIGSIAVNYKNRVGGTEEKIVAGILDVKAGLRLFPILTSIGRNIGVPRLNFKSRVSKGEKSIELWPSAGVNLKKDSLAYCLLVGNPDITFEFPDDFPRNVSILGFRHFQIIFLYWLFNQPTKFRGTSLTFSTPQKYVNGFEFHEALNFTNDVTLMHAQIYPTLPDFPKTE